MERFVSSLQPCAKNLVASGLRTAITFEAEAGYQNSWRRNMRFNQFLVSKISKLCYRSKHKLAEKLLEEADNYGAASISDRSKLLDKVSVMLGYSNLDDLVDNQRNEQESGLVLEDQMDALSVSLACRQFSSITLGSSPLVELYTGSAWHSQTKTYSAALHSEEFQPILADGKWMVPESLTESYSFDPSSPNTSFSVRTDEDLPSPFESQSDDLQAEQLGLSIVENSPSRSPLADEKINELMLDMPISSIRGLSKRRCRQLEDCGFHTVRKLLHHFPRTYADLQNSHFGIEDGQYLIFVGRILSSRAVKASYSLSFLEVIVRVEIVDRMAKSEVESDDTCSEGKKILHLHLKKFFRGTRFTSQGFLRCLKNKHIEGDIVCVSGKVRSTSKEDHYEMREYSFDVIENEEDSSVPEKGKPYPIYPSKGVLKPEFFREIIIRSLQSLATNVDPIPEDITRDIGLLHLHDAYVGIHQPKDLNHADSARKRFVFDEFFYLQLGRLYQMLEGLGSRLEKEGLLDKYRNIEQHSILIEDWSDLTKIFFRGLPYELTKSQLSAVSEIIWDLKRPVPMNRLLQGDVGCGKTVVAFLACMEVIGSGYQAAYMVPTELLAIQHYKHLSDLLETVQSDRKPSIALLTGSTPAKQARMIRNDLQTGSISLVIGTHSLIAESVEFSALRLAVIDEQHRFGVIQRGRFNSKLWYASSGIRATSLGGSPKDENQMAPHVLAMSATPIPRSLALALYGDMSLTQITDLPPGRLPIETNIIEGNQEGFEKVYEMMHRELETGGKVYLVYPIIEQSEQLPELRSASGDFETICSRFPCYNCGLLHGKMKSDEKDEALRRFKDGETPILLATQVIEIGVDVPDASMMVVMNAERFGMAQLHQLRGRVGRGARKSKCLLVASTASSMNRLKVLEHSSDGFHLAKVDLLLRGPGDLLGKKQSGHLPEFPIARLEVDGSIIQDAHIAALRILSSSHDLEQYPLLKAELSMRQPLSLLGD